MTVALLLAALSLLLVSLSLTLRVLVRVDAIGQRVRQTWLQLSNVISMLSNSGFKVKKPRDWNDDFNETRLKDPDEDPRDWFRDG